MKQVDKIEVDSYKQLLQRKAGLGAKVAEFVNSDGFLILKAVFYNFERDIKDKKEYKTLEDFKADRKAIDLIEGIFEELNSYINDAEQAQEEINKLIEAEGSTPSILSLDGEGIDDGRLSDF